MKKSITCLLTFFVITSFCAVYAQNIVYSQAPKTVNYVTKWQSFGVQDKITNSQIYDNGLHLGIGTIRLPYYISLNGDSARTISLLRQTNTNNEGRSLTIQSGGAPDTTKNRNGGDLILKSAVGTGTGSSNLVLYTSSPGPYSGTYDNVPDEKMRINGKGNVGIGTNNPAGKLDIKHSIAGDGIILNMDGGNSCKSEIKFFKNGQQLYGIGNDLNNDGRQTFFIWDCSGQTGFAPLYIAGTKVGIGGCIPPTPDSANEKYNLYVESGIVTRDVKVTANAFQDYVFYKDYKLMSIYQLQKYIDQHNHLPDFPSEAEVKNNNGFELGDIQLKLLKTVEEQALYIIELQRQIDELKQKVEQLK
jgi:hypothetical protein